MSEEKSTKVLKAVRHRKVGGRQITEGRDSIVDCMGSWIRKKHQRLWDKKEFLYVKN